jgi:hypothetical protein
MHVMRHTFQLESPSWDFALELASSSAYSHPHITCFQNSTTNKTKQQTICPAAIPILGYGYSIIPEAQAKNFSVTLEFSLS